MQRKVRCTDNPANELMDSILQKRKNEKNLKNSQVQNYLLRLVLGFLPILDEKSRFGDRSYSGKS